MAVPFLPVTFCPMVVPPVPEVPLKNRSWKVQPGRASWVTLSYFSTTMAFSGVFWKVRVLLSLPWRMIFWVEGSFIWKPGAGSTSVTVYSPG